MRRFNFVILINIISAQLLLFMLACSKPDSTEIRIGVIVPLTGAAADFGKWAQNGVDLAVEETNKNLSTGSNKLHAIYVDNQMDPKAALSGFKKLVDVDHVSGVISSGSGVVLAIAPVAERQHIVQINHAAVSPAIRKSGEYTFTLVNDADVETDEIAKVLIQELGLGKLAIFYANAAYGVGTKDALIGSFTRQGGEISRSIAFPENFTDIRAQLLQLREMNPPAVYFIATIKDSGRLLRQAKEMGIETQWVTYNAFESPEILEIAGEAAEGVIYTSSNLFDLPEPELEVKQFLQNYLNKFGSRPNLYAATAYDAARILALAVESTDGSGEQMQTYLSSLTKYHGASGIISFDKDGSVKKPVFLKTIRNGEFVLYNK